MSVAQPPINHAEIPRLKPVIGPGHTYESVTDQISSAVLTKPTTLVMVCRLCASVFYIRHADRGGRLADHQRRRHLGHQHTDRLGICHRQFRLVDRYRPRRHVDFRDFVFVHQKWRTSINRFAEAMTLFAVACAGMFPLLHTGRPWMAYWLFPYPNTMWLWPQFRSPLIWDVFAVSTYVTVSLLFWFMGLVPDLATLRDRALRTVRQNDLWIAGHGLARFGAALAAL